MPVFAFKATVKSGKLVAEGSVEAPDETLAKRRLAASGLRAQSVEERSPIPAALAGLIAGFAAPPPRAVALFYRQLAVMFRAGTPLVSALDTLSQTAEHPGLGRALRLIETGISSGHRLSAMMAQFPDAFPEMCTRLVAVGEESGDLGLALERAAEVAEKHNQTRERVISALTYPAFIFVFFSLIGFSLMLFVVPKFAEVLQSFDLQLNPLVLLMMKSAQLLAAPPMMVALVEVFILVVIVARLWTLTPPGRRALDAFLLRLPAVRPFLMAVGLARLSHAVGVLTANGVTITDSLVTVAPVVGNSVLSQAVVEAADDLAQGWTLSEALQRQGSFPATFVQMVQMGEETGTISRALGHLATIYEQEVEATLTTVLQLLEPTMIIVMGVFVGGLVLAMLGPMSQLLQGVGA